MSTRAVVTLMDRSGRSIRLYCAKDGYVRGGIGEWLHDFCESYDGESGVPEVLYAILSKDSWLSPMQEIVNADYEYDVDCSDGGSLHVSCREVCFAPHDHTGRNGAKKRSIDLESELNAIEEFKWRGLSNCPFCGQKPSTSWSAHGGSSVFCDNAECKGNTLIGRFEAMHDAELAWNDACEKLGQELQK